MSCEKNHGLNDGTFGNFAFPQLGGGGDFIASTAGLPTSFSGVEFNRKYRYAGVQFKLGSDIVETPRFSLMPFLEMDIDSLQQDYKINIGSLTGAVTATRFALDEHLTTHYFDFGIGFDTTASFSSCPCGFFVFGEAAAFVSCADTSFKGEERIVSPTILPRTFSGVSQKNDALSFKGRGQLGIGYRFSENVSLTFMGQVEYFGYVPKIRNPHRVGTDLAGGIYDSPAVIDKVHATNYGLLATLSISFN